MANKSQQKVRGRSSPKAPPRSKVPFLAGMLAILVVGAVGAALLAKKALGPALAAQPNNNLAPSNNPARPAQISTMPINQAVMVTVELDFGGKPPSIAEALREVERRSKPDDGVGRTFAILDAYGEPTPEGKLHMSMHVSTEKAGVGSLVFRRTGEVLWESRIVNTNQGSNTFHGKNLLILVDNGEGKTFTVDGSGQPASILDANIKEMGIPVRLFWPDNMEREVTFIFSACGCPVKAMVKRVGEKTVRTKELPVMFPDDPAALATISHLMQW